MVLSSLVDAQKAEICVPASALGVPCSAFAEHAIECGATRVPQTAVTEQSEVPSLIDYAVKSVGIELRSISANWQISVADHAAVMCEIECPLVPKIDRSKRMWVCTDVGLARAWSSALPLRGLIRDGPHAAFEKDAGMGLKHVQNVARRELLR